RPGATWVGSARSVRKVHSARQRGGTMLEFLSVRLEIPEEANIIVGQSHFIKTVEDLYEAVATTSPYASFGLAFNESSGECLVRSEGNDNALREASIR